MTALELAPPADPANGYLTTGGTGGGELLFLGAGAATMNALRRLGRRWAEGGWIVPATVEALDVAKANGVVIGDEVYEVVRAAAAPVLDGPPAAGRTSAAVTVDGGCLAIRTEWPRSLLERIQQAGIPATWSVASQSILVPAAHVKAVQALGGTLSWRMSPEVSELPDPSKPTITAEADGTAGDDMIVRGLAGTATPEVAEILNGAGAEWDQQAHGHRVPLWHAEAALTQLAGHYNIARKASAAGALERGRAMAATLAASSSLTTARTHIPGLAADLRPWQGAAIDYIERRRRCIVSEEVGLGKTVISLAAAQLWDCYPLVIACPTSLCQQWRGEALRFLPHGDGDVTVLSGLRPGPWRGPVPKVIIVGYDVLHAYVGQLELASPRGLIVDESQMVKHDTSRRSNAAAELGRLIPPAEDGGLILLLSATPVENRRVELAHQLEVLGVLDEMGGKGAVKTDLHINDRMRAHGLLVRHRQADVYPDYLPIDHQHVPVELTPEALERIAVIEENLRAAVIDLAKQRAAETGEDWQSLAVARWIAASRAQTLVQLGMIRKAISDGKIPATIDFARAYLAGHVGPADSRYEVAGRPRKILVFSERPDTLDATGEALGCPVIHGGTSKRDDARAIAAFQTDPAVTALALSSEKCAVGFNLTAATCVAQVDFTWVPTDMDQAVGRAHFRAGDPHPVWSAHLFAAGTYDERMVAMLAAKRIEVNDATDGTLGRTDRSQHEAIAADVVLALLRGAA